MNTHPISVAIGRLLHRCRDLQVCASIFLDVAKTLKRQRLDELKKELEEVKADVELHKDYTTGLGTKRINYPPAPRSRNEFRY